MNEQEFVLMQLDWLRQMYDKTIDVTIREAIIRAIVDISTSAMDEDTFPGFDTEIE